MVQNVAATNQTTTKKSGGGIGNAIKNTASTALPGAAMGGAVGGFMAILPRSKNAVKAQLEDAFMLEAQNEIKSQVTLDLLNRKEIKEIKDKFVDDFAAMADEAMKKLPKKDELIKFAKKAAKNKNAKSLIQNGALFGMVSVLIVNLIQSIQAKKNNK